jgi:thioesterase domain-containing protein
MAQQLRQQGEEVAFLGLIDSAVPKPLEGIDDATVLAGFLRDLGAQAGKSSGKSLSDMSERLRDLDSHAQVACVLEEAVANGTLPPQTDAAQLESLLRVFQRNVQALSSYVPQRYDGRLALFRATGNNNQDLVSAWANFAAAIEIYSLPGSHYTVMTQPNVHELATLLSSELIRDHQ